MTIDEEPSGMRPEQTASSTLTSPSKSRRNSPPSPSHRSPCFKAIALVPLEVSTEVPPIPLNYHNDPYHEYTDENNDKYVNEETDKDRNSRDLESRVIGPAKLYRDHEGDGVWEHDYPDGGYGWVVVVCCMVLAGFTMGWGISYGVYQEYYVNVQYRNINTAYLSLTASCQGFFMSATAFIAGRMGDRYGFKIVLSIGTIIAWIGVFSAAFATQFWHVILCQGIITGTGQGVLVPLFMSLPSQWFCKRRGLASGLALGGGGLGGGTLTLITRQLITAVGVKKTLIIMSFINLFFMSVAISLIRTRPQSPEAQGGGRGPIFDREVMKKSEFWSMAISLLISVNAYNAPFTFMSQFTADTHPGLSAIMLTVPLTILTYTVAVGRSVVGLAADNLGPLNTYVLAIFLAGISQFALWLTARSFASILVFAIVYGTVAPGYLTIMPQIVVALFGPSNLASNVGLLMLFNAPGNLAGAPLAGAIFDGTGKNYKWMIIAMGSMQVAGALVATWARYKANKQLIARV